MRNFLEHLRARVFWILDKVKGSPVKNHYRQVIDLQENSNFDEVKNYGQQKLGALLKHAANTTAYYSKFNNSNELKNFPVVNKNIIRQNEALFISTAFDKATLSKVVTSGSTGTPFCVYHDVNKKIRNTADTLYFAKKAGFELGQKLYYFKIWNDINKKSGFSTWSQNIEACNVFELSDDAIKRLIKKINTDKSNIGLLAYASAYDAICRVLDADSSIKIKAKIKSAIAMSEALNCYTKEAVNRHFNCVCVSRYSNVENGMIAQQSIDGGNEFYINFASYAVEILNINNDEQCPAGEEGRVVVTDLYNYGMPMIRYDTGDIGVMNEIWVNGIKIPVLEKIEGRKMDMVYNTNGDLVSSFTITNNMWKYTELKQYQFIQTGSSNYLFKLNCDIAFSRETELINEFRQYFGTGAVVTVEYVNEIPLLNSGKRKKVMNLMNL